MIAFSNDKKMNIRSAHWIFDCFYLLISLYVKMFSHVSLAHCILFPLNIQSKIEAFPKASMSNLNQSRILRSYHTLFSGSNCPTPDTVDFHGFSPELRERLLEASHQWAHDAFHQGAVDVFKFHWNQTQQYPQPRIEYFTMIFSSKLNIKNR